MRRGLADWTVLGSAVAAFVSIGCAGQRDSVVRSESDPAAAMAAEIEQRLADARLLEREGRLVESRDLYTAVLDRDPRNVTALHRLGVVCSRLEDDEIGGAYFARAVQLAPERVDIRNDHGYALFLAGDLERSEEVLRQALDDENPDPRVVDNLAMVVAARGRSEESFELFRRVFGAAEAHAHVGFVLARCGDVEGAIARYSAALAEEPGLASASQAMAQLEATRQGGEFVAARAAVRADDDVFDSDGAPPVTSAAPSARTSHEAVALTSAEPQAASPTNAEATTASHFAAPVDPSTSDAAGASPASNDPEPWELAIAPVRDRGDAPSEPGPFERLEFVTDASTAFDRAAEHVLTSPAVDPRGPETADARRESSGWLPAASRDARSLEIGGQSGSAVDTGAAPRQVVVKPNPVRPPSATSDSAIGVVEVARRESEGWTAAGGVRLDAEVPGASPTTSARREAGVRQADSKVDAMSSAGEVSSPVVQAAGFAERVDPRSASRDAGGSLFERLERELHAGTSQSRLRAAHQLRYVDENHAEAIETLESYLVSGTDVERRFAATSLATGPATASIVPALERGAQDDMPEVHLHVMLALARQDGFRDRALPVVREYLVDDDPEIRRVTVLGVGRSGLVTLLRDDLLERVNDGDEVDAVREAAAASLRQLSI